MKPTPLVELELAEPGKVRRWFPTTAAGRWDLDSKDLRFFATAPVHAKEMGTTLTACGRRADGWLRMWEFAIPTDERAVCPRCLEIASSNPRARGSSTRAARHIG